MHSELNVHLESTSSYSTKQQTHTQQNLAKNFKLPPYLSLSLEKKKSSRLIACGYMYMMSSNRHRIYHAVLQNPSMRENENKNRDHNQNQEPGTRKEIKNSRQRQC